MNTTIEKAKKQHLLRQALGAIKRIERHIENLDSQIKARRVKQSA